MNNKILIYEKATSSNDIARELAEKGEGHATAVVVLSQTSGRGRMGRSFISNSENGLYMSIILRPSLDMEAYKTLTAMTCVAVLRAIEKTANVFPKIKWVNDLYLNDRKICGILAESKLGAPYFEYIICGIGINITPPLEGFDPEISKIAGAVFEKEAPQGYKMELCEAILNEFFALYDSLPKKDFMKEYKLKSSIIGKTVDVYAGDSIIQGTAIDIDENAELVVKCSNGEVRSFNSGEARVRKSGESL